MAKNLTVKNFKKEVLESKEVVLVDFWAEWCGPCKAMSPIIEELSKEVKGVLICKVNIEEEESISSNYGIMSIPTFLFFKNGKVVEQMVGMVNKKKLKDALEKLK